ncbi:MAG: phosphoglycerate dehydrogenase [Pyrinomonadaceae bacterium]|nr:phosphoglycerate dehydrogenase [Phycisphaerales bacterium]
MQTSFPKSRIKVVLVESVHACAAACFQAEGFAVKTLAAAPDEGRLIELAREAHVIGLRSKTEATARVLASAPKLLAIGCFCIGTNQVALKEACLNGVPVFNSPFSNTRSVAELTIAEAISLTRRLFDKSSRMHEGEWDKSADGVHEVRGRTLGIVGYGHIGSQVSVLAEAMGMRVLYYDIIAKLAMGNAQPVKSLGALLEQSDIVTLHVPATAQTKNMIREKELGKMKRGSFLINNARGSIVDIDALATALTSGHLAGAAVDVFPDEPAGKGDSFESRLKGLRNVILTPHIGGSTEEAQAAIAQDVCAKLIKYVNNGSTTGSVNVPQVELPEQAQSDENGPGGGGAGIRARPHRILHFHRNTPGVLKNINGAAADLGANIASQHLQTNSDIGYVVIDVDPTDGKRLVEALKRIPETIRVRMLW